MFFPGTPNIFVPGDSVFMLFKCMCNSISIEKKIKKNNEINMTTQKFYKDVMIAIDHASVFYLILDSLDA